MNTKQYILAAALGMFALTGCKKELDLAPTDTFTEANAFLNMDDATYETNAIYARYASAYLNDIYASTVASDEAKLGAGNAGQGALEYRLQYTADDNTSSVVTSAWGAYYYMIDQANRVLSRIDEIPSATPADDATKTRYKGEAMALRAIGHYELLRNYAGNYDPSALGVPVMTSNQTYAFPARNTMGEVMTQIETDLSTAKTMVATANSGSYSDTAINNIIVAGFQARVALYKGDFDAAINYATEVINSGIRPLDGGSFPLIWTDQSQAELLFRYRFATSTALGSIFTTTGNSIYFAPSDKLIDSYDAGDIRPDSYFASLGGNNLVYKYYISPRGGRVVDLKAMRTAEMYLIRAEAYARKAAPDVAAGAADLNALRAQRIVGYTDETFTSASALLDAVILERYKELCFEGFRFYDLKRLGLPLQRSSTDAAPAWQSLDANSFRFVFPIPNSEMLVNKQMVQNPGY
jgi:hypothetical protein